MSPKPHPDIAIAKALNLPPEAVTRDRKAWNENHVLRAVFTERLMGQIEERRRQLETITPEELKSKQGEIAGLKTALALVTKNEI